MGSNFFLCLNHHTSIYNVFFLFNFFVSSIEIIPSVTILLNYLFFYSNTSQQCFAEASTRRPADLLSSFSTIKNVMNNLYDGLAEVLMCLLKNTNTRENVLQYLAEVINKNKSRAHIQVNAFLKMLLKLYDLETFISKSLCTKGTPIYRH